MHKELYQHVSIQPIVYYPVDAAADNLVTEAPLPGALSDYKLYFSSAKNYLHAETNRRFMPIGAIGIFNILLSAADRLAYLP